MLNYYVDPGQGFVFSQNLSFLWGILLGMGTGLAAFFRFFVRSPRKKLFWAAVIVLLFILGGVSMRHNKNIRHKKVVVIGVDALDPALLEEFIAGNMLPNLARLAAEGAYSRLETTVPSESVVAWTSFSTGLRPGGHGIFDFVMRKEGARGHGLYLSLNEVQNNSGRPAVSRCNKGRFFWEVLSDSRIYNEVYFCPNTFPPGRLHGRIISGMGVPDITGTNGRSFFYTSERPKVETGDDRCRVVNVDTILEETAAWIYGPLLSSAGNERPENARIPMTIEIDAAKQTAVLRFQGKTVTLRKGEWSSWQKVSFSLGGLRKGKGIIRFYLKSVAPSLGLYATPVNFDPTAPLFPISYPADFSRELVAASGMFYTQGMPADTWALSEGKVDESEFLSMIDRIFAERKNILENRLKRFREGMFFFYLDTLDSVQHMFWRYRDGRAFPSSALSGRKDVILEYYRKIDEFLGEVMRHSDEDTVVMVLSDHGFTSFRKAVDLNRWLSDNGYLYFKDGIKDGGEFLSGIDWSRTRAYAIGFGGIYLNKTGREYYGIVRPEDRRALEKEISRKLRDLKDPVSGEAVVNNVYEGNEVFSGPCRSSSPDLYAGFAAGYRGSWQTALGGVSGEVIRENDKKWSGDHIVDPAIVPGVLLVNKKVRLETPSIIDIAPTVLRLFGVKIPVEMPGKVLFEPE
ncbi:MAG: alkaline phosphatase family protein [Candidatus Omnitrophota bacterium]|jgi:predicted AlkP superfamily phosphohydrolase/phosphomutase